MTRTAADTPAPSTRPAAHPATVGDTVLVNLGAGILRPLIVAESTLWETEASPRVSGHIVCVAADHLLPAFRGGADRVGDPATISGRPERNAPYGYADCLSYGTGVGQWRERL
jgi:hypothetical protein